MSECPYLVTLDEDAAMLRISVEELSREVLTTAKPVMYVNHIPLFHLSDVEAAVNRLLASGRAQLVIHMPAVRVDFQDVKHDRDKG